MHLSQQERFIYIFTVSVFEVEMAEMKMKPSELGRHGNVFIYFLSFSHL